ncbi:MAG: hypothetical protein BWZ10_02867 [candidate division BRC1 bacterium ADurb.BinA364]|nr:MAG: hypothetical protein BWZ10_02867 [candidate division BRC1 bacterium ADurb.BinA364]
MAPDCRANLFPCETLRTRFAHGAREGAQLDRGAYHASLGWHFSACRFERPGRRQMGALRRNGPPRGRGQGKPIPQGWLPRRDAVRRGLVRRARFDARDSKGGQRRARLWLHRFLSVGNLSGLRHHRMRDDNAAAQLQARRLASGRRHGQRSRGQHARPQAADSPGGQLPGIRRSEQSEAGFRFLVSLRRAGAGSVRAAFGVGFGIQPVLP